MVIMNTFETQEFADVQSKALVVAKSEQLKNDKTFKREVNALASRLSPWLDFQFGKLSDEDEAEYRATNECEVPKLVELHICRADAGGTGREFPRKDWTLLPYIDWQSA